MILPMPARIMMPPMQSAIGCRNKHTKPPTMIMAAPLEMALVLIWRSSYLVRVFIWLERYLRSSVRQGSASDSREGVFPLGRDHFPIRRFSDRGVVSFEEGSDFSTCLLRFSGPSSP